MNAEPKRLLILMAGPLPPTVGGILVTAIWLPRHEGDELGLFDPALAVTGVVPSRA
jgi:hypothetical protein